MSNNGGNYLAIQWLGFGAFSAGAQIQLLVGELTSHKPHCMCVGGGGCKNNNKQKTAIEQQWCERQLLPPFHSSICVVHKTQSVSIVCHIIFLFLDAGEMVGSKIIKRKHINK